MGSFVFRWDHPADDVHVTGTFDDWSKSERLERVGDHFEKNVHLSKIDEKIYYKFVVNNDNWTTDHTAHQETDSSGNTNNVLTPENIVKDVAHEDLGSSELPGAFPETPGFENPTFGINPLPATAGAVNPSGSLKAGEGLPLSTKSVNDHVTLDQASYENSGSGVNPPTLPDPLTPEPVRAARGGMFGFDNSTTSGSNIIPESGLAMGVGAGAGLGAAALADSGPHISSVGPSSTTAALAGQVPLESEHNAHVSPVGPSSTTSALAGGVPFESTKAVSEVPEVVQESQEAARAAPEASANSEAVAEKSALEAELLSKVPEAQPATTATASSVPVGASHVPEVVQESQEVAHVAPEASANPQAVADKSAVEEELQSKVSEAPATTDAGVSGKAVGLASAGIAGAGAAAAGIYSYLSSGKATTDAKDTANYVSSGAAASDAKSSLPVSAQKGIDNVATSTSNAASYVTSGQATQDVKASLPVAAQEKIGNLTGTNGNVATGTAIAPAVPDTVQESITKAHESPEAAANPEAVREKSAVEAELLGHSSTGASTTGATSSSAIAASVPDSVQESIVAAHQAPEAAANPEAVQEKSAVESELLSKVPEANSSGVPAPTATAATTETAPVATEPSSSSSAKTAGLAGIGAATGAAAIGGAAIAASKPSGSTSGLAAPASSQAQTDAGRDATRRAVDSRDVSPMTRTANDGPQVTSGITTSETPKKSSAPAAISTPSTPAKTATPAVSTPATKATAGPSTTASPASANATESPATDKKKNRRSFFGKLKDKLEHRKEKN